jgi:tetratricopeptide (TPR) repeat protein
MKAQEFVREVKDQAWIGFLSACQSAVAERTEYSNLARELVKAGVPFALGMQFNLPDPFAPNISGQFYNYLSQGHGVSEATRQARRAVKRENEFYVGMIALYATHPNEVGKMRWTSSVARIVSTFAAADVSDLPMPSGFIGRQRELMNIGTKLLEKKKPNTVTLHGAGGIGKTALMRQVLLRFAPLFDSALATLLDPLPSLESVLGRIERFLGLPSPSANETKEREKIISDRLTSKRILLGLDNFETLNYALNEKGSDAEKTAKSLHSFFNHLSANGVTLCITSREVTNLGGELIIDIEGLPNDEGGRLFQENVVRQKDEIYIEKTQQVSKIVGGHPLALRLLAAAFDDQVETSLDQYIEDLHSFLPQVRDKWTEEDRHESLRASFDFTINELLKTEEGKNKEIALSKLSVFSSFFVSFIAAPVLENRDPEYNDKLEQNYPEVENLLHILWKRGLLDRVNIKLDTQSYWLYRLHPMISFFAGERITDINLAKEYYWKTMSHLAHAANKGINRDPALAQIVLRALPDMLKAAERKSNQEDLDYYFLVVKILQQFGYYNDAMRLLEQAHDMSISFGNKQAESAILQRIAYTIKMRGDLDGALRTHQQALKIDESLNDLQGQAATLSDMAGIIYMRGDLPQALKLYEQSLKIEESLFKSTFPLGGLLNDHAAARGVSVAFRGIAKIYVDWGNLDKAMEQYQLSLAIEEGIGNLQGKSVTLNAMAAIMNTRGDLDGAVKLYSQSLKINEDLGDLLNKSRTLHAIGGILLVRGDLDGAMKLFQQSMEINEFLNDQEHMSALLYDIANIMAIRGDLNGAMKNYTKSLEIKEASGDLNGRAAILHGIGKIYVASGNLNMAMGFFQKALEFLAQIGNHHDSPHLLRSIADIHIARGNIDEAIKLHRQCLKFFEDSGNMQGKGATLSLLGQLFVMQKNFPDAILLLVESLKILSEVGAQKDAKFTAEVLEDIRYEIGEKMFDALWKLLIKSPMPDWLSHSKSNPIVKMIRAVRRDLENKRSKEVDKWLHAAKDLATDLSLPKEHNELGRVLQRIILGEKNVDLSSLPKDWAEAVTREFGGWATFNEIPPQKNGIEQVIRRWFGS